MGRITDGFYIISSLNPYGYDFNYDQEALIGIQPGNNNTHNQSNYDLQMDSVLAATPDTIYYGDPFEVKSKIENLAKVPFTGDISAALFDSGGNFIDYIAIFSGTLPTNSIAHLTFESQGMLSAIPGNYTIEVYYSASVEDSSNGAWTIIPAGTYNNSVNFTVITPPNDLKVWSNMVVSPNPIVQNEAFNVKVDVANLGTTGFHGDLLMDIYSLDLSIGYGIEGYARC